MIAAFVLEIGDVSGSAPNANFDYETDSDGELEAITHTSGDSVDSSLIDVQVGGGSENIDSGDWESGDISAGDTLDIEDGDLETTSGTTTDDVVVVWESDGNSATIAEWEE